MIAVFGLPFFLAGLSMLWSAYGTLLMRMGFERQDNPVILGPTGFVFLAVGGIMVFGRQLLILDLGRGSIIRQSRLLIPLRTEERPLSEFNAVVIAHDPGGSDSAETYPVRVRSPIGKDVVINKPLQFAEALRLADYLARTLHLQLVDSTTDHETTVGPERAGEPLLHRLSRVSGPAPQRPLAMRSEVDERADVTKTVLPAGSPKAFEYLGVFLPLFAMLLAMLFAIPSLVKPQPPASRFAFLGILLFLFGLPAIFAVVRSMIVSRRRRTTVTASPSGLVIERPLGRHIQTTVIPAKDLLDLDTSTLASGIASARRSVYKAGAEDPGTERVVAMLKKLVPNPGIIVKSRSGLITIGEGLPTDELQYLAWLLRKALSGLTDA